MLFELSQVDTQLKKIEEIPDTFFREIPNYTVFGYDLLPDWFPDEYGPRQDGLYAKANRFFTEIKNSGREADIILGYNSCKDIQGHCTDIHSIIFYCEQISQELQDSAKTFFTALYKSLDSNWLENYTGTNVLEYIRQFKRQNNVFLCPLCGNEPIKSTKYESRSALDHWFSKAKYPLTSVHLNNLLPMGEGCNRPSVKGEKEIVWTDDNRISRQEFQYPFLWNGDLNISLSCLREPANGVNDFGEWRFNFVGINAIHQDLIDKWNTFFRIGLRWIDDTLLEFIETWTYYFSLFINEQVIQTDVETEYIQLLTAFKNAKTDFDLNPLSRVQWFFLDFIINRATAPLFESYKQEVIKLTR